MNCHFKENQLCIDTSQKKCLLINCLFFIQNDNDEPLRFSSVNVMPRIKAVKKNFDVASWMPKYPAIEHVESRKVVVKE